MQKKAIKRRNKKIIEQAFAQMEQLLLKLGPVSHSFQEEILCLLQECQELAISTGQFIEENIGEEQTIHYLEEFCELLYQISLRPEQMEHYLKMGLDLLGKARTRIEQLQMAPIEIVFFPYKASMWDSLESIWKAADEDPECNAYVVPIPYYDMLPGGSDVKLNDEKDMFPSNIPVVNWEDYHLEEQQPDIIVVHNPYDDSNRVTSVKPEYFSNNLRKYTDLLVYVPYYMTTGRIPEDHIYLKSYRNFDKIIVQNANYVQEMKRYIPEEKIIPLGSPKYDCIVAAGKNPKIPEEWKSKIEGKKIIFFNLSISCFLKEGIEEYLHKVEYFFDLVNQYDNLVLIWRPHPLLESTMNSMRGHLQQYILEIQEKFKKGTNMVYDRTPNPELAIAISDVYVGETQSSIVAMFAFAQKPIYILSKPIYMPKDRQKEFHVKPMGMLYYKNSVYFACSEYQLLCRLHLESGIIEPVLDLDLDRNLQFRGKTLLIRRKSEIWILLDKNIQDTILIYDCDKNTADVLSWPVPNNSQEDKIEGFFWDFDEDNSRNIYFWTKEGKIILQVNTITREIKHRNECIGMLLENYEENKKMFGMWTAVGEEIYCVSKCSNEILQMNLKTNNLKIHKVGAKGDRYYYIYFYSGKFYLAANGKRVIYEWDPGSNEVYERNEFSNVQEEKKRLAEGGLQTKANDMFYALLHKADSNLKDHKIYIFSKVTNHLLELSTVSGIFKKTNLPLQIHKNGEEYDLGLSMFGYQIAEHKILGYLEDRKAFLLIDPEEESVQVFPCVLNGKDIMEKMKKRKHFKWYAEEQINACKESEWYRIDEFLEDFSKGICDYEKDTTGNESNFVNSNGMAGLHIYQYLKGAI